MFFCSIFLQKILTDLKLKVTKFELSTTFQYRDKTILIYPKNTFFAWKNCQGFQLETKFQKVTACFLFSKSVS